MGTILLSGLESSDGSDRLYAQLTSAFSVKQVASLPVLVFCMCFMKFFAVLLKIT